MSINAKSAVQLLARRHRRPGTLLLRRRGRRLRDGWHRRQRDRLALDAGTAAARLIGARRHVSGLFGPRGDVTAGAVDRVPRYWRRWRRRGNFILIVVYQHDVNRVDILVVGLRGFTG